MLELAILGEFSTPQHGYELRKRLSTTLGPLRRLSFGSLYPALHRLLEQGLIQAVDPSEVAAMQEEAMQEAAAAQEPPSQVDSLLTTSLLPTKKARAGKQRAAKQKTPKQGATRSRRQVVYKITPAGEEHLLASLQDAEVDDESMPLTMGLMSRATPATRLNLLKERRAQVVARKEAVKQARSSKDFWIRSRAELDSQQAQTELDWLDRLIKTDLASLQTIFPNKPDTKNVIENS